MTPSTTFQWPLSPAGIFQPVKSLPLKMEANFGCWPLATVVRARTATVVRDVKSFAVMIGLI